MTYSKPIKKESMKVGKKYILLTYLYPEYTKIVNMYIDRIEKINNRKYTVTEQYYSTVNTEQEEDDKIVQINEISDRVKIYNYSDELWNKLMIDSY